MDAENMLRCDVGKIRHFNVVMVVQYSVSSRILDYANVVQFSQKPIFHICLFFWHFGCQFVDGKTRRKFCAIVAFVF